MSYQEARNKLFTTQIKGNTLYNNYLSNDNTIKVEPTNQMKGIKVMNTPNTTGWRYVKPDVVDFSAGSEIEFNINKIVGNIGDMFLRVELPRYQADGITEVQYKPLPALQLLEYLEIDLGATNHYRFSKQMIYNIIQYVNDYESKEYIFNNWLGGYGNGQDYVTNPGVVWLPIPCFGSSVEVRDVNNDVQPFPMHLVRNGMFMKLRLSGVNGLASTDARPKKMKLWYREHVMPDTVNPITFNRLQGGSHGQTVQIPERHFVSHYQKSTIEKPFTAAQDNVINLEPLSKPGELMGILVHLVTKADEDAGLHFNFNELTKIQLMLHDGIIYNIEDFEQFKIETSSNSKVNNYCIGSRLVGTDKDDYQSQKYAMHVPLTNDMKSYRDYLSHGVNPEGGDLSITFRPKEDIVGTIYFTAVYRSILTINPEGHTMWNMVPGKFLKM